MYTLNTTDYDAIDELALHPMLTGDGQLVRQLARTINAAAKTPNPHNDELAAAARAILTGPSIDVVIEQVNAAFKRERKTGSWR